MLLIKLAYLSDKTAEKKRVFYEVNILYKKMPVFTPIYLLNASNKNSIWKGKNQEKKRKKNSKRILKILFKLVAKNLKKNNFWRLSNKLRVSLTGRLVQII
jgi:hypothetical protein